MRRLGTVRAILGAAAALDVEQDRALDLVRRVVLAVDKLRLEEEIHEGGAVDFFDVGEGPVVSHGAPLYPAMPAGLDVAQLARIFLAVLFCEQAPPLRRRD